MKTSVQCRGTTRTCPGAFYIPFDWIHVILCFAVQIGIKTFTDLVKINSKSILKKVTSKKTSHQNGQNLKNLHITETKLK